MQLVWVIAALIVSASALSEGEYLGQFQRFLSKYKKEYGTPEERTQRFNIFKSNLDFIDQQNKKGLSYTVGVNKFADLTNEEFNRIYLGFRTTNSVRSLKKNGILDVHAPLPSQWDWRDKHAVSSVKDQGQCGSCWSFSAVGSIEGAWAIHTSAKAVSLSEQNVIDCSWNSPYNNTGCDGGDPRTALQYVIDNKGIDTEEGYPYEDYNGGDQETCQYTIFFIGGKITYMIPVISGNETDLAYATLKAPVSVAIYASHQSFQFYQDGIYYEPMCGSTLNSLDHGVLTVGFIDGAWLVKNSWGSDWGMSGYIQMSRDEDNNCGIATYATVAML